MLSSVISIQRHTSEDGEPVSVIRAMSSESKRRLARQRRLSEPFIRPDSSALRTSRYASENRRSRSSPGREKVICSREPAKCLLPWSATFDVPHRPSREAGRENSVITVEPRTFNCGVPFFQHSLEEFAEVSL